MYKSKVDLSTLVDNLSSVESVDAAHLQRTAVQHQVPSREVISDVIEMLRSVLFPGYYGPKDLTRITMKFHLGAQVDRISKILADQINRGFCFDCKFDHSKCCSMDCESRSGDVTDEFLVRLPQVQTRLISDVRAAFQGDPAAVSPGETIFCYPGIYAMTNFRIAHELYELGVPLVPRMITELAHAETGIDIHPGASIGDNFFIDHGTGIVIGETTIIGNRVRIYQGVTLGAKSFPLDEEGNPIKGIDRHPLVEDDVIIYSGATILGRVVIGQGSVIGGNVWLTRDVPPGSRITQRPSRLTGFNVEEE